MPLTPEKERQFKEGAKRARPEFEENWNNWSARDVAVWLYKWRDEAAYDRLCRIMLEVTGVKTPQPKLVLPRIRIDD